MAAALPAMGPVCAQTGASLLLPSAIAYDAVGNVYFADTNRNQVLEATLGGQLIVVAGNGVQGFAGDGGSAVSAELNGPQGVAVGGDGTVYIADTGNQRVRAVIAGTISTFAGNGVRGFAGDGGVATAAEFSVPVALAVDASGALLVCDSGNQRVRRIAGGVITTIAGNGLQGFAGDGGAATAAELDTPMGVAASEDGRIFVSDTRNDRVRMVSVGGTISTFAGTGVQGFEGDRGAATAAELALPRGLVLLPSGALLIADENNQRVRMVDASGAISTVQGTGVQGAGAGDGVNALATMLNSPRSVGVSKFAQPAVVDSANKLLRVEATNASLYAPAGLAVVRRSSVAMSAPATAVYGQLSAGVAVTGEVGVAQGVVNWLDGDSPIGSATLSGGSATTTLTGVGAGNHALSAAYLGDGLNPAATNVATNVTVTPAPVVATANAATMQFGTAVPALTGTLSGVLPQDSGNVAAQFSTTATDLSPIGTYPIGAVLRGGASANYAMMLSTSSGNLTVAQAASSVTEQLSAQSYAGFPMILTATVSPPGLGTPTGSVAFLDGANVVASASVAGGVATGTYLAPTAGTHAMTAKYSGDGNFLPSTSAVLDAAVGALPDFTVSVANPAQSVQGGLIATYTVTVAGQGPFSGAVSLAVSGVPAGATVSFSPPQVTPGAGSATAILSVQTTMAMASRAQAIIAWWAVGFALPVFLTRRRRCKMWLAVTMACCVVGLGGCGDRSLSTALQPHQSYTFTVTGTGTNLAGVVVTHSAVVTMVVQ
jgi:hypothetical protein